MAPDDLSTTRLVPTAPCPSLTRQETRHDPARKSPKRRPPIRGENCDEAQDRQNDTEPAHQIDRMA